MKIQFRQDDGNTMAIGAIVTIFEAGTNRILGKQMLSSDTEGCHPRLHFGLAKSTKVDVAVTFPSSKDTIVFTGIGDFRTLRIAPAPDRLPCKG